MSLKNAALLALIGTILLTVLIAASFIFTLLGVMRGVIARIESHRGSRIGAQTSGTARTFGTFLTHLTTL